MAVEQNPAALRYAAPCFQHEMIISAEGPFLPPRGRKRRRYDDTNSDTASLLEAARQRLLEYAATLGTDSEGH